MRTDEGLVSEVYNGDNREHGPEIVRLIREALAPRAVEGKTLADIGQEMEAYRRAGMAGCKFKVGGLSPEEDARRVEAARRAAGPDFVLVLDEAMIQRYRVA